jgi:hypothetical protein
MTHTPGPWNIWYKGEKDIPAIANNYANTGHATDICTVDGENQDANAHLIAAAPELLEACEAALEVTDSILVPALGTAGLQLAERLRAAIAKARGE